MISARHWPLFALFLALLSCGGGERPAHPSPAPSTVTFVFRCHGLPTSEEFRYTTPSQDFIAKARAQLLLPEAQRHLFPSGSIAAGNGGFNHPWSWHFVDATLVETATELCDGRPSFVEADLNYWLNTVKCFCPWGGYVYMEAQ